MNPNSANPAEWRVIFFIIYYGLKAFTIDPPPDQRREEPTREKTLAEKKKLSGSKTVTGPIDDQHLWHLFPRCL